MSVWYLLLVYSKVLYLYVIQKKILIVYVLFYIVCGVEGFVFLVFEWVKYVFRRL